MMKILLLFFSFLCVSGQCLAADITLLVLDNNSYLVDKAVSSLELPVTVKAVTASELTSDNDKLRQEIDASKVIIVDVMGRDLEEYMVAHIRLDNKIIYALRGSTDDERLARLGFRFDDKVANYYRHIGRENIKNMVRLVANHHFDTTISFEEVVLKKNIGIWHPAHAGIFVSTDEYEKWQRSRSGFDSAKPRIGFLFFSSSLTEGQQKPVKTIIDRLEAEGFNVLPCFGKDQRTIARFLLDGKGQPRVDLVLAFTLKFYSALTPELADLLQQLNVPVINAINLYQHTLDEWRQSPVGIGGNEVAWAIATPEMSGLIEPTPLAAKQEVFQADTGKSYFVKEPIPENIDLLMVRIHKLVALQQMSNASKKVAIMFYNHHQGKQNIGASYLNVFRSLQEIIRAMAESGYRVGKVPDEEKIEKLIMTSARNIGSWAPGELTRLLKSPAVVRLPVAKYKEWFSQLPEDFQENVIKQWGQPEDSKIMLDGTDLIIPAVQVGNILLLPEPSRGWGDDPQKLYHDTTLYPHHQYLAVYLWLNHGFKADAMIHLGTHATYEWTPGKQAGLSPSCPPEVLLGHIPNIYPYIVDDVGEGIQAKRRGRAVIISHLTPMLKEAGLYKEYSRMSELINEYERAKARNSSTVSLKYKELLTLAKETGILADIASEQGHSHGDQQQNSTEDELVHHLGHYLEEIRGNLMPYGMHTFGRSPAAREITDMTTAVLKFNPEENRQDISSRISKSAPEEMVALLAGLNGKYVEPGEGNDSIRNPSSLPTGRNFYGFNPQKIPSPAAWQLGKKAADEIIAGHLRNKGDYPQKVAVVLWATETMRNEGVNESTILYLMGIKPKWTKSGRVRGVEVIPGRELNRPRIDVMVNASGLYRDLFPDKLQFVDKAVQLALRQTDIDNLLAAGSRRIKTRLMADGMTEKEADELSRLRVFSAQPGAYGTGVASMASMSGTWQQEKEVVDVYENRVGFVYGGKRWGVPARKLLKANLAEVEAVVHSRSSNIYGLLDNDDMFQYLGALSMAVRLESGNTPETLVTQQQKPGQVNVEDMAKTLGREMRSRYLNPKWIKAMQQEGYAGAREMANFVEYLWGWDMTTPEKVDEDKWQQTFEVYVEDKYGLEMDKFLDKSSPWAKQSISARMLETIRKGYWQPGDKVKEKLAATYARSVVAKGVACCDHTCNNPLLNQMVVSILSMPGVMNPKLVADFKIAIEQAAEKSLAEQVKERHDLQQQLTAKDIATTAPGKDAINPQQQEQSKDGRQGQQQVEGYKMEKVKSQDQTTEVTSSGVEWLAGLFVLFLLGLVAWGMRKSLYRN